MEITPNTRVSNILKEHGDIAGIMEIFGVRRVGKYSFRRLLTKVITVKWAARVHGVPQNEFLQMVKEAVATKEDGPKAP